MVLDDELTSRVGAREGAMKRGVIAPYLMRDEADIVNTHHARIRSTRCETSTASVSEGQGKKSTLSRTDVVST